MTAIIIQKSKTTQIRVEPKTFKERAYLDIREYSKFGDNKDFRPTKSGVTIPPENVKDVLEAIQKHQKTMAVRVVDQEAERTAFVIGRTAEDAVFAKKHIYDTEDDATGKAPPDGYKLFRVLIKDGVVLKQKLLYERIKKRWKEPEPEEVAEETPKKSKAVKAASKKAVAPKSVKPAASSAKKLR